MGNKFCRTCKQITLWIMPDLTPTCTRCKKTGREDRVKRCKVPMK